MKELKNLFLGAMPTYGLVWHFLKEHEYITQRQEDVFDSLLIFKD